MNITISFKSLVIIIIVVALLTVAGIYYYTDAKKNAAIKSPEIFEGLAPNDPRMNRVPSPLPYQVRSEDYNFYTFEDDNTLEATPKDENNSWINLLFNSMGLPGMPKNNNKVNSLNKKYLKKQKGGARSVQFECATAAFDEPSEDSESVVSANATTRYDDDRFQSSRTRMATMGYSKFKKIGIKVLKDIIIKYGGDVNCMTECARIRGVKNASSGQSLEFDTLYCEGTHTIAVDFNGYHHYKYPNTRHRSREDYRKERFKDAAKSKAAESLSIYRITVPETCISKDESESEQYFKMRDFIEKEMVSYYNQRLQQYSRND